MMGYGFGFMGMGIFWIVLVVLCVWLLFTLFPATAKVDTQNNHTPLDILQRRYASGELSKEQFENMRQDLEK